MTKHTPHGQTTAEVAKILMGKGCEVHSWDGNEITASHFTVRIHEDRFTLSRHGHFWTTAFTLDRIADILLGSQGEEAQDPAETASPKCEGCDDCEGEVLPYILTNHEGERSLVHYCPGCNDLAQMDWNGNTASIVPADPVMVLRESLGGLAEEILHFVANGGGDAEQFNKALKTLEESAIVAKALAASFQGWE